MRAWSPFFIGAALIAAAYFADEAVTVAMRRGIATFDTSAAQFMELAIRAAALVLVVGLAWLVARGRGSRIAGLAMVVVGFYVGFLPQLSGLLLANANVPPTPFTQDVLRVSNGPGGFTVWTAGIVMVLGFTALIRPSSPEPSGSDPGGGESVQRWLLISSLAALGVALFLAGDAPVALLAIAVAGAWPLSERWSREYAHRLDPDDPDPEPGTPFEQHRP